MTAGQGDRELEAGRLSRLPQNSIVEAGCDAGLFYDPTNIRYATGTSNMQVYSLHNPCRYVFVPAAGTCTLFEFKGCAHLSDGHLGVGEIRPAISWYDFITGDRTDWFAKRWADEILELLGPGHRDIAVDRLDPIGPRRLQDRGVCVHDGQRVANRARMIKTPEEVEVLKEAVAACEAGVEQIRAAMQPGLTRARTVGIPPSCEHRLGR